MSVNIVSVAPIADTDMTIVIEFHPTTDQIIVSCDISPIICSRQQMEKVVEVIQNFMNQ